MSVRNTRLFYLAIALQVCGGLGYSVIGLLLLHRWAGPLCGAVILASTGVEVWRVRRAQGYPERQETIPLVVVACFFVVLIALLVGNYVM